MSRSKRDTDSYTKPKYLDSGLPYSEGDSQPKRGELTIATAFTAMLWAAKELLRLLKGENTGNFSQSDDQTGPPDGPPDHPYWDDGGRRGGNKPKPIPVPPQDYQHTCALTVIISVFGIALCLAVTAVGIEVYKLLDNDGKCPQCPTVCHDNPYIGEQATPIQTGSRWYQDFWNRASPIFLSGMEYQGSLDATNGHQECWGPFEVSVPLVVVFHVGINSNNTILELYELRNSQQFDVGSPIPCDNDMYGTYRCLLLQPGNYGVSVRSGSNDPLTYSLEMEKHGVCQMHTKITDENPQGVWVHATSPNGPKINDVHYPLGKHVAVSVIGRRMHDSHPWYQVIYPPAGNQVGWIDGEYLETGDVISPGCALVEQMF
ncbi:MAG: hypothetical protein JXQ72_02125 [Anaerolineae bacterium]|nr:hypothetical protein [Anaerolineae bacterium]